MDRVLNSFHADVCAEFNLPPLLSFFTGAGFLDIGFLQAGFPVVWHNEINSQFVEIFNHGMRSSGFKNQIIENTHSLVSLRPQQIFEEALQNLPCPDSFGIIAGPPCPDFSEAGVHRGKFGENGPLLGVTVDRILALKPTFFLIENVPGLFKTKKHFEYLSNQIKRMKRVYFVGAEILDALDFGVPQERKRGFIIGFRKDFTRLHFQEKRGHSPLKNFFRWPVPKFPNAKNSFPWPGVNLSKAPPQKPIDIPDELMVGTFICSDLELKQLPNSDEVFSPKSHKFHTRKEGETNGKSFKRLHRWRYSPAAAYGHNEVHLHPIHPRRLSVREALRIQTVPDSYAYPEQIPLSYKYKTVTNGVPVKLAKAVAESIKEALFDLGGCK